MRQKEVSASQIEVHVKTAGRLLDLGRGRAYQLVGAERWPTPVLRLGRLVTTPTARFLTWTTFRTTVGGSVRRSAAALSSSRSQD